ncbi:MAG: class I SAM-dependent methyltransferase [Cyanobacteriota bacterium]|nr:class I SAM-dependent methyltransferase [Cyanobacteriota bacterium]
MTGALKRSVIRALPCLGFGDRPIHLLGHPYALARTALREALGRLAPRLPAGPLLDVGCGTMPYRALFPAAEPYEGLEIDQERNRANPRVTHFYDGHTIPLAAERYAAILCSQVLEHSFSPERLLAECHRLLRPGGALLLTIPFLWPEHEQPWDSQRFTRFGLRQRLEAAGFRVEGMQRLNPGLSALLQLSIEWNESIERRLGARLPAGWPRRGLQLLWRLLWALPYSAVNLLGALARALATPRGDAPPRQEGAAVRPARGGWGAELYLDLVVLAVKADPLAGAFSGSGR